MLGTDGMPILLGGRGMKAFRACGRGQDRVSRVEEQRKVANVGRFLERRMVRGGFEFGT